jgi:two-component system cell cycle response regulator
MAHSSDRLLLIDPASGRREMLARRLEAQGYTVEQADSGAQGAELALSSPPSAVVADLWMPNVSGVQLCRLLGSEPATASVPVILCADRDDPRNRFWAERAGAVVCVVKGRTAELVRALSRAIAARPPPDDFFVQISGGSVDIQDRISRQLDRTLFDTVIAGEVRSLASAGSFERLFDSLAQLLSQVMRYRWVALCASPSERWALHRHPSAAPAAEEEARRALGVLPEARLHCIEDEDATADVVDRPPEAHTIMFGGAAVGRFAISAPHDQDLEGSSLGEIVARELGGPLKMTALIEESQRMAATDSLTGLMNRRAFAGAMRGEIARCRRYGQQLSLALLDVDHFKRINDSRGHGGGDRVLAALGKLLQQIVRASDYVARWGGEEFVVAYSSTGGDGSLLAAERLREAIAAMQVTDEAGEPIPVTVSVGVAELGPAGDLDGLVDRADRAMYASKAGGRNRVTRAEDVAIATPAPISRVA